MKALSGGVLVEGYLVKSLPIFLKIRLPAQATGSSWAEGWEGVQI